MAYHALYQDDTQDDTITLLERCSTSSTVLNKVNDVEDNQHQERQLATPQKLVSVNEGLEWLQDFEEIARANNWSSRAKLDIIPVYLQEKSTKTWFRENLQEWSDFDSFKLAYINRFRRDSSGQFMDAEVQKEQQRLRWWIFITIDLPFVIFPVGFVIFFAVVIYSNDLLAPK
ncbi:hypothetical protein K457DRAFT_131391 [Linnemannia elongata AG-77]|uniref:Uncharacterized protein n=1 Tax=Linnemannia elongata AG-77 TaxID=1314771 RepID=A0A197JAZ1_9FUNG|nr:hypothetical protein K457DRAFT_131391 [Linnemannia elongata AG-77]